MKQGGDSRQFEHIARLTSRITKPSALRRRRGARARKRSLSPDDASESPTREKALPVSRNTKPKHKDEVKLDLGSVLPAVPHIVSDRHRTDRYGLDNYYVVSVPTNCSHLLPPIQGIARKYIDDGFYAPPKTTTLKPTLYDQSPHVGPTPKSIQEHDQRFSLGKEKSHSVYELRSIVTPWGLLDASEEEKQVVAEKRRTLVKQSVVDAGLSEQAQLPSPKSSNIEFRPRARTPLKHDEGSASPLAVAHSGPGNGDTSDDGEPAQIVKEVRIGEVKLVLHGVSEAGDIQETSGARKKGSKTSLSVRHQSLAKTKRDSEASEFLKPRKSTVEAISKGRKTLSITIAQDNYMSVYHFFEKVMGLSAIVHPSALLHESYVVLNQPIDQFVVRKMDRRKSGVIEFIDMLRVFFPQATEGELTQCIRLWGSPAPKKISTKLDEPSWKDRFTPTQVKEIEAMYNLFWDGRPLTIQELRKHIPETSMPTFLLEETFRECDKDCDGELSLEEFATSVEASFKSESIYRLGLGKHRRTVYKSPVLHFSSNE